MGGAARADADPVFDQARHYLGNLQGVVSEPLTDEDMRAIASIDRNCRLIKGQVFLWREGQTWEDLWDLTERLRLREASSDRRREPPVCRQ